LLPLIGVATVFSFCLLAVWGCARPVPFQIYEVRGLLTGLPSGPGGRMITIRHEAVPSFVLRDGSRSTMDGMEMPFPLAADVDLGALRPGDAVAFRLRVSWEDPEQTYSVTAIRPLLPAGKKASVSAPHNDNPPQRVERRTQHAGS
jgi:hypothetical protein